MKDREFNDNPYYSPELCGLKMIAELAKDPDYDFDMVVVWEDLETGKLYWDNDSGCSCPTPFEDVRDLADLAELDVASFPAFSEACRHVSQIDEDECRRFIAKFKRKVATVEK